MGGNQSKGEKPGEDKKGNDKKAPETRDTYKAEVKETTDETTRHEYASKRRRDIRRQYITASDRGVSFEREASNDSFTSPGRHVSGDREPREGGARDVVGGARRKTTSNYGKGSDIKSGAFDKTAMEKKKASLVVAAIDFGTTYSGYAYSFYDKPDQILTNIWPSGQVKTPTVVLMKPNGTFHSFGEEAQLNYKQKIKDGTFKQWYFFEKFKMQLYNRSTPLDLDIKIEDMHNKPMKAIDVFTGALGYIRQHLMNALNDPNRPNQIEIKDENDIHWVLTVPAIWSDLSKKFMREAASRAGIPGDKLTIALEPEAASLYCKRNLGIKKIPTGCRYMVVDIGGGTTDITCHEVQANGTLKEIHPPSGGGFGGMDVDNAFLNELKSIFSAPTVKKFKNNNMEDYWEMLKDLEVKKRNFNGNGEVRLKFPAQLADDFKADAGMDLAQTVQNWPRQDEIQFQQDKIKISETQVKKMFDAAVKNIKESVESLQKQVDNIEYIILVGGFSESPYLRSVMEKDFNNLLIYPSEAALAVLKGAVIYGHKTTAISSRTCGYTYGIARMNRFIPGTHPEKKKVVMGDYTFCEDMFHIHIKKGTMMDIETSENDAKYHDYFPAADNHHVALLEVYKSARENPTFVTEPDCTQVGYIIQDGINPRNDRECKLFVRLIFGGTELIVEIKKPDGEVVRRCVDFL